MTSQPQCQDMCQTPCMQMTLQYGMLKNTPPQLSTASRTPNEVCSWAESWALQLNTTKLVSTLFTLSTAKEKVSLKLNNQPVSQVETTTFIGITLDTRLTWKPHLKAVEVKDIRKLAIMKKTCKNHLVGGGGGGGGGGQLWQSETGLHRGCKTGRWVWFQNLEYCLKNQQKQARQSAEHGPENHRIILGAMRSTPVKEMVKITDLQPLACRREYKAAIQGETLKRLTSHPLHQKFQHGTKHLLKRKSFKHQLKDLQKENVDLLEADPERFEELTTHVWAPRKSLPEVRAEILGPAAKGTQPPELQKALTLKIVQDRYPKSTRTHVFKDGSAENAVRNEGCGAYICRPDGTTFSLSIPAGDLNSYYRAELHNLNAATGPE